MRTPYLILTFAALMATTAAHAIVPIQVSLESEAPGIQDSTSGFFFKGVERFDNRATGYNAAFSTDFGSAGVFSGTYTGAEIFNADQYGGAGGAGKYAVTFGSDGYTLDLSSSLAGGVTYFGFWLSALDRGNTVTFYGNGTKLFAFAAADAKRKSELAANELAAKAGVSFDKIVFAENPLGGGYESDNHTVGQWKTMSGTLIPNAGAVPEPETWALLIGGFSLVGYSMRRNRRAVAA